MSQVRLISTFFQRYKQSLWALHECPPSNYTHRLGLISTVHNMHVDTTIDGLEKDTYLNSQVWNHFKLIPLLNPLFPSASPTPNKFLFHVSKHLEIPVLSSKMLHSPPLPKSSSKMGRVKNSNLQAVYAWRRQWSY